MAKIIHPVAGLIAFTIILVFWTSTVLSELMGDPETVIAVKKLIPWGLLLLVPAMMSVGMTGNFRARGMKAGLAERKRRRMPLVAFNGFVILIPCALFLAARAHEGNLDTWFFVVQAIELVAGATNIILLGLNIRDGLRMTGRLKRRVGRPLANSN